MPGGLHIILGKMKPDGDDGLEACAEDVLAAVEGKDVKALAAALKAAFDYLEAQPHAEAEEGE